MTRCPKIVPVSTYELAELMNLTTDNGKAVQGVIPSGNIDVSGDGEWMIEALMAIRSRGPFEEIDGERFWRATDGELIGPLDPSAPTEQDMRPLQRRRLSED